MNIKPADWGVIPCIGITFIDAMNAVYVDFIGIIDINDIEQFISKTMNVTF